MLMGLASQFVAKMITAPHSQPLLQGFDKFKASLTDASGTSRVDLVLSCVDNYEARMTINEVCVLACS